MKALLLCPLLLGVSFAERPIHFHLAFAGTRTDGMTIAWETKAMTSSSVCKWGSSAGMLDQTTTGIQRSDGAVVTHVVTLSSLAPRQWYYYSCGTEPDWSPIQKFLSGLRSGMNESFSFALVGDMGIVQSNGVALTLMRHVDSYDFVYHVGDVGYADDYFLYLSTYDKVYSDYMDEIEPFASQKAYMALPGNHEASCNEVLPIACPERQKNFTAWRSRWAMPSQDSNGVQNMWYSFDYGLVHFIQISTETDFPNAPEGPHTWIPSGPFGDQLSWLEADLERAVRNRANVPWIIVAGHRPIWFTGGFDAAVHNAFLPLLTKFNVDFFLAGHEHNYERYWPIDTSGHAAQKDYNNPKDIIFLINGQGGNAEGHEGGSVVTDYLAFRQNTAFGWSRFNVHNSSVLSWEFIGEQDTVLDRAVVYKQR